MFSLIRDQFAATPEAKARGYTSRRFSFNVEGGRCEACQGEGNKRIEIGLRALPVHSRAKRSPLHDECAPRIEPLHAL